MSELSPEAKQAAEKEIKTHECEGRDGWRTGDHVQQAIDAATVKLETRCGELREANDNLFKVSRKHSVENTKLKVKNEKLRRENESLLVFRDMIEEQQLAAHGYPWPSDVTPKGSIPAAATHQQPSTRPVESRPYEEWSWKERQPSAPTPEEHE